MITEKEQAENRAEVTRQAISSMPYQLTITISTAEKTGEPQTIGLRSLSQLRRLSGPGMSNEVVCDLKRYGECEVTLGDRTIHFQLTTREAQS